MVGMTGPDLTRALQFDLSKGTVRLDDGASVVVSAKSFGDLLAAVSADVRARIASELGASMGARLQKRSGGQAGVRQGTLEAVVSNLSAELALAGLGSCTLERWGRAMVMYINDTPIDAPDFIAVLITSAISTSTGAAAYSTVLSKQSGGDTSVRVLIASQAAAQRVRNWLDQGVSWGDAITRLQGGAS